MRLSQAEFAAAVRAAGEAMGMKNHCTKRLVQKWETGEHGTCRGDYLRILQAVTGLSPRELGFAPQPEQAAPARADPLGRRLSPNVDFAQVPARAARTDAIIVAGADFQYAGSAEHAESEYAEYADPAGYPEYAEYEEYEEYEEYPDHREPGTDGTDAGADAGAQTGADTGAAAAAELRQGATVQDGCPELAAYADAWEQEEDWPGAAAAEAVAAAAYRPARAASADTATGADFTLEVGAAADADFALEAHTAIGAHSPHRTDAAYRPDSHPGPNADCDPNTDSDPDADTDTDSNPNSNADANPDADANADADANPDADSDPRSSSRPNPDPNFDLDLDLGADSDSGSDSDSDSDLRFTPASEADTAATTTGIYRIPGADLARPAAPDSEVAPAPAGPEPTRPERTGSAPVARSGRTTRHSGLPAGAVEHNADRMLENALSRLRFALEHPSTVDSHTADYVETATDRLYDLEHHSAARLIAPTVERHLATVTALLTAARHENVRRRLLTTAGRTTALAGWVAFDRGDFATANRFWDIAVSAAETTHDDSLYACCFTFMSFAAARRGDPCSAWQMAHTAGRHTLEDRRAAAWAVGLVGLHAAELGQNEDAIAASELSLERGLSLPAVRPGDGTNAWTRQFDRARLLSCAARTAALLDDPRTCQFAADAVAALGPARVKSRAIVLAEATLATALAGEFELSLDYGSAATVLARELEVSPAIDVLYSAIPVLMPHATSRAVRELLPQLTRLSRFPGRH